MKKATKKISVKEYINGCDPKSGLEISNYLIDFFIQCNPHRKDMSRKDWLDILFDEYVMVFSESGLTIEPSKSEPTINITYH